MPRFFLSAIAVVCSLALAPAAEAQAPRRSDPANANQVYVKVILTTDRTSGDKERPVVESWIADELKRRGHSKFSAATAWVPLVFKFDDSTAVWNGQLDGKQCHCPVSGDIPERANGRIKVLLSGWAPFYVGANVSLTDEPGSRAMVAVEEAKADDVLPYVAVLIGPPPTGPNDDKKAPVKRGLCLEVELERGKELDRLTVYIFNDDITPFAFETGARGGPGSLDDRMTKEVYGTPPTVLPEVMFSKDGREVILRPPAFGGPTNRRMLPSKTTLQPGQRHLYASFAVPKALTAGKFVQVKLRVGKDRYELIGFESALIEKRQPPK